MRVLFFILFCSLGFAQGEANFWYFGWNAGLDFSSGSPVPLSNGELLTTEGCSTISDSTGQLLFYTDGRNVWNRNHLIMPNGYGLKGEESSSQSAIIVPKPDSSTSYYIFTIGSQEYPTSVGLTYSEVDLGLDGGLGDVTSIKNILIYSNAREKLTAIKNEETNSYWIVIHGFGDSTYLAYNLTSSGLNTTPVVSNVGSVLPTDYSKSIGYLKFSPDGTKLVCCATESFVELLDFNITTGIFSNARLLADDVTRRYYGAEFSPSGNVLYVSEEYGEVYQFDLTVPNIRNSQILICNNSTYKGALQLGYDGKIYCAIAQHIRLDVIDNPEILGTGCSYNESYLYLDSKKSLLGLPQFIPSLFNSSFSVLNICFGELTQFEINNVPNISSILWDFGDGNTSTDLNPSHEYAFAGEYNAVATITTPTGVITKHKLIKILQSPVISTSITNQSICGDTGTTFDLSQHNNTILGLQSDSDFGIAYFNSLADANAHTNVLSNNQNLVIGNNTFYAKIYNLINTKCNNIASFTITLVPQPIANPVTDYFICENSPYDNVEQFDLTAKNSQILNGQNASDYTISYHLTQSDANNDSNPLPLLYTNSLPQETIYARIEHNLNVNCFDTTSFHIEVVHEPQTTAITDYKICDDVSNDGIATFDLSTKIIEILNGQPLSSFPVRFYSLLSDAQNEVNEITAPISNTTNNQVIYYTINVLGNTSCKVIGTFKLVVYSTPIANPTNNYFLCDDITNDGIGIFDLTTKNNAILLAQSSSLYSISYHLNQNDADINVNPIPTNTYLNSTNPQTIFARVENKDNNSCFATTSFKIGLYQMPIAHQVQDMLVCDDDSNDGSEVFDLSVQDSGILNTQSENDFSITYYLNEVDAIAGNNALPTTYNNTINSQTIFARIENKLSPSCYDITSFKLIVRPKPMTGLKDFYSICEGSSLEVNANLGFTSYLWSNADTNSMTTISVAGNYSLTVTKDYGDIICDATKNFIVYNSNIATITKIDIQDWTDNENTISIQVTGDGDYEYSLDDIHYQDSNQFYNVSSGEHTVFVRDKKGCGTTSENVFLLMYPKFFTPNGDGFNDYWQIKFSAVEPNLKVELFDRYGKLIKVYLGSYIGWDGTLNGSKLPSDDYWFVVTRANGKIYRGHFSMKR